MDINQIDEIRENGKYLVRQTKRKRRLNQACDFCENDGDTIAVCDSPHCIHFDVDCSVDAEVKTKAYIRESFTQLIKYSFNEVTQQVFNELKNPNVLDDIVDDVFQLLSKMVWAELNDECIDTYPNYSELLTSTVSNIILPGSRCRGDNVKPYQDLSLGQREELKLIFLKTIISNLVSKALTCRIEIEFDDFLEFDARQKALDKNLVPMDESNGNITH